MIDVDCVGACAHSYIIIRVQAFFVWPGVYEENIFKARHKANATVALIQNKVKDLSYWIAIAFEGF